jgi:hypothetical protein
MKFHLKNLKTLLAGAALMALAGVAVAHHSFAMFDQEHPIDLVGVVNEWKYTAPHTFIILEVKEEDGTTQVWSLEGGAPSGLSRDGWTSKTLKPGDELQLLASLPICRCLLETVSSTSIEEPSSSVM